MVTSLLPRAIEPGMCARGVSLEGTVSVAGAKNSTTRLMIAACLAEGPSEFDTVPSIADAKITAAMLEAVGAGVAIESGAGRR